MNKMTLPRDINQEENAFEVMQTGKVSPMTFVLFGATGDLAKRKIFPALYNMFLDHKLSDPFSIVGIGRRDWSDQTFKTNVKESIRTFSRRSIKDTAKLEKFLSAFRYTALDVTNSGEYKSLLTTIQNQEMDLRIPENRLFYLSVAPEFVDIITSNIKESGLGSVDGWKRLIVEKPFGHDLNSARELNEKLSSTFEEEIYRIDHYLGKPMVQNLETLGFANPILRSLWNKEHIANVQITASETVGVEERAGYYDQAGAIRDMVQNHLLQMVMMTAMPIKGKGSAKEVRDGKRNVMEALRPVQKEDVAANVVRGQYGHGEILGASVVAYREEPGVDASSKNDTFIAARLWVDNEDWAGVPFYIRTGKRMQKKLTSIVVEFKQSNDEAAPNCLTIDISPSEGVSLQVNMKNPLNNQIEPVLMDFTANAKEVPEAYELLLFDAMRGNATFFAHWKEVELSWKWVQSILEAFQEDLVPLHSYSAGSMGPDASHQLRQEDGFK
jgi:glucose-6-phosphate 1-dehydrogenase